jgi:HPt (histidine-containing phosphotransfer) domain-containing protein
MDQVQTIVGNYCNRVPDQFAALFRLLAPQSDGDIPPGDAVTRAFAQSHRMAGAALSMGFEPMGNLLSALEQKLESIRSQAKDEARKNWPAIAELLSTIEAQKASVSPENSKLLSPDEPVIYVERRDQEARNVKPNLAVMRRLRVVVIGGDPTRRALLRNALVLGGVTEIVLASSIGEAAGRVPVIPSIVILDETAMVGDSVALLGGWASQLRSLGGELTVVMLGTALGSLADTLREPDIACRVVDRLIEPSVLVAHLRDWFHDSDRPAGIAGSGEAHDGA